MKTFICLIACALLSTSAQAQSIGDRLTRTYTVYASLPTTVSEAKSAGWSPLNASAGCDANLGIAYGQSASGITQAKPLVLYFNAAGQVAGAGVKIFGAAQDNLVSKGFWQKVGNNEYYISVSFRNSTDMCSGNESPLPLGDRLTVNANSIAWSLPVLESDAVSGKWVKGSCFSSMGHHYFYDLSTPGSMSWDASALLPVVLMMNDGQINAFFFASTSIQEGITGAHQWEPVPLPNFAMCKNWCDPKCTFAHTSFWSTLHVYLSDYKSVTCPGGCTMACCP